MWPVPVAPMFKAWICGRLLAGITGSIPATRMDVCLLGMLRVVMQRADHSLRGVLPSVVCLTECGREASIMRKRWSNGGRSTIGVKG